MKYILEVILDVPIEKQRVQRFSFNNKNERDKAHFKLLKELKETGQFISFDEGNQSATYKRKTVLSVQQYDEGKSDEDSFEDKLERIDNLQNDINYISKKYGRFFGINREGKRLISIVEKQIEKLTKELEAEK